MSADDRSEPPNVLRQVLEGFLGHSLAKVDPERIQQRYGELQRIMFNSPPLGVERADARVRDMQMQAELQAQALAKELAAQMPSGPSCEEPAKAPRPKRPMTRDDAVRTVRACPAYASMSWKERQAEVTRLCQVPVDARGFSTKQLRRLFFKLT
jgi:hypothetical protein